jgi:hypothetical protein
MFKRSQLVSSSVINTVICVASLVVACGTSESTHSSSTPNTGGSSEHTSNESTSNVGGTSSHAESTSTGGTSNEGGSTTTSRITNSHIYAVIIKAAGYVDPSDTDTLSTATTEPYNTHVFADTLATRLKALDVNAEVVNWLDCAKLSCLHVPNSTSTANIVVFAGATHNGNLPEELQAYVPTLGGITPAPQVVSALTSCNQVPGTDEFVAQLEAAGLPTIAGVAPQTESKGTLTDSEMTSILGDFAQRLTDAIE